MSFEATSSYILTSLTNLVPRVFVPLDQRSENESSGSNPISIPEPTCLLVSTKTRSSGIINFQRPRFYDFRFHGACVVWFTWRLEIKSMWIRSSKAFNTRWKNWNLILKEQQYQILKAKDTRALGTNLLIIPELRDWEQPFWNNKGNNGILPIRFHCAACIYGACLKWLLPERSFSERWSRGTKTLGTRLSADCNV